MHTFKATLAYLDKVIYEPNEFIINFVKEEKQNSEYAAGTFTLSTALTNKTVRLRVAKVTPNKIGQFVTFWEKDAKDINQPFRYDESPDLLVVTTFANDTFNSNKQFGQFVFPKNILVKKGILKSDFTKGKMGIRVYPSWDKPTSKIAIKTQHWQLEYFLIITNTSVLPLAKILALYE